MYLLPDKVKFVEELNKTKATLAEKIFLGFIFDFSLVHHLSAPPRATGEHYFWHIYRAVMRLLTDFNKFGVWDMRLVAILLLHDVVEDARQAGFDPELVLQKIIKQFGNEIAFGTMAITKQGKEHARDVLKRLIYFFYWLSLLAKIYDRNDNLGTLYGMSVEAQIKKLEETEKYFSFIFNRVEAELLIAVKYRGFSRKWLKLLKKLRKRHEKLISQNKTRLAMLFIAMLTNQQTK